MPKEPKLFPEHNEPTVPDGQSPLVNQKADFDIPEFDVQSTAPKEAMSMDEMLEAMAHMEKEVEELNATIARQIAELEALAVNRDDLQDQLDEARKAQPKATSGSLNHAIFCAVVNGFAARGDLSLGKLSGDSNTQQVMRHAAGITSFAAAAVKDARL